MQTRLSRGRDCAVGFSAGTVSVYSLYLCQHVLLNIAYRRPACVSVSCGVGVDLCGVCGVAGWRGRVRTVRAPAPPATTYRTATSARHPPAPHASAQHKPTPYTLQATPRARAHPASAHSYTATHTHTHTATHVHIRAHTYGGTRAYAPPPSPRLRGRRSDADRHTPLLRETYTSTTSPHKCLRGDAAGRSSGRATLL